MAKNPAPKPDKDYPKDSEKNGFLDSLPEELRDKEIFKGLEDTGQLAQKTYELGGRVWELAAGRPVVPEAADDYDLSAEDGIPMDKALVESFKSKAHEAGLTQEQASAVAGVWNSWVRDRMNQRNAELKASIEHAERDAESGLKDIWKSDYDRNMDSVLQVLRTFGTDELKAELNRTGRGNSIHFTRLLHRIHSAMGEDTFVQGDPNPPKRMRMTRGGTPVLSFPSMENRA